MVAIGVTEIHRVDSTNSGFADFPLGWATFKGEIYGIKTVAFDVQILFAGRWLLGVGLTWFPAAYPSTHMRGVIALELRAPCSSGETSRLLDRDGFPCQSTRGCGFFPCAVVLPPGAGLSARRSFFQRSTAWHCCARPASGQWDVCGLLRRLNMSPGVITL